ncbi:hypothetical protein D1007_11423 [Hordeum vulgare]|nr:hypothetical protein D1007_11423 [Hordeum vulgare]
MDTEKLQAEHEEHVETEEIQKPWHIQREEIEHVQREEAKQAQLCASAKLPVFGSTKSVHDKGKGIAHKRQMVNEDDSESVNDRDYDISLEESKNLADSDEVIEYRKYAQEFKEKKRKKMLGEEQGNTCNVPDNFIVLGTCKIDEHDGDETPCFEGDDDLSYDEASDGEVWLKKSQQISYPAPLPEGNMTPLLAAMLVEKSYTAPREKKEQKRGKKKIREGLRSKGPLDTRSEETLAPSNLEEGE